jgi:hypothetical protein
VAPPEIIGTIRAGSLVIREARSQLPQKAKKREKDTRRSVLRYAERHLLCREAVSPRRRKWPEPRSPPNLRLVSKYTGPDRGNVDRLHVFELIGKRAQGKACEAIQGVISSGTVPWSTRYGTLKTCAMTLGKRDVASLLDKTLQEDAAADKAPS